MLSSIITWEYVDQLNQTDGIATSNFITKLDWHKNVLLLLGRLNFPFDDALITIIKRIVASALSKRGCVVCHLSLQFFIFAWTCLITSSNRWCKNFSKKLLFSWKMAKTWSFFSRSWGSSNYFEIILLILSWASLANPFEMLHKVWYRAIPTRWQRLEWQPIIQFFFQLGPYVLQKNSHFKTACLLVWGGDPGLPDSICNNKGLFPGLVSVLVILANNETNYIDCHHTQINFYNKLVIRTIILKEK